VGDQQLSINIKSLFDYLKSSENYCPRKLFSGSNSSPEISTRQKLTEIIWYKYFGAKFTKPVREDTGSKCAVFVSPAFFMRKQFLVRPIHPIMERVPRTGGSVYRHPPPPPDLLPVMASTSADPVATTGLVAVVPSLLRPHVPTVHTAHMTLFTQAMYNPAQVAHLWVASMAAQTMVQQHGGGQSIQQQGDRQIAQLACSKTGRHESAAGAVDEAPKSPNRRGKKKQKVIIHPTSVTTLRQIRTLRVQRSMVISVLLVPFSSAQRQQSLTCLLLIVTGVIFGRVFRQRE